jgi:hypothetical protein
MTAASNYFEFDELTIYSTRKRYGYYVKKHTAAVSVSGTHNIPVQSCDKNDDFVVYNYNSDSIAEKRPMSFTPANALIKVNLTILNMFRHLQLLILLQ